jgi:hypothetical protein
LNGLIKNVEYYKIQNGKYPDNLKQLENPDDFIFTHDPTQSELKNDYYNYKNLGENFLLFSSGSDQIRNTKDDIYPETKHVKNSAWIKNSNSR